MSLVCTLKRNQSCGIMGGGVKEVAWRKLFMLNPIINTKE